MAPALTLGGACGGAWGQTNPKCAIQIGNSKGLEMLVVPRKNDMLSKLQQFSDGFVFFSAHQFAMSVPECENQTENKLTAQNVSLWFGA